MINGAYLTRLDNGKTCAISAASGNLPSLINVSEKEKQILEDEYGHPLKNLLLRVGEDEYELKIQDDDLGL
ncbi:hypothetical protein [Limosilactobacillus gastricus]|uniref:hypothetical protein n=1 Tax=Limosilactobacillus gastricus TaxID=227942 RepID=UPI0002E30DF2|nr:hypothetical protein [Limosilactobacillus gastricus]